jgi:hypothetical protein
MVGSPFRDHNREALNVWMPKNNRSKSAGTLMQRKWLNNQAVWPVIFGLTGPICARALKSINAVHRIVSARYAAGNRNVELI